MTTSNTERQSAPEPAFDIDGAISEQSRARREKVTHVGRRTVLGLVGAGALGIAVGAKLDGAIGGALTKVSNSIGGLGALVPGADNFRIYTVTGTIPTIDPKTYKLTVNGMVDHPLSLSLDDLRTTLPRTSLVHYFQCVTGWRVPDVHWQGVKLSDVLEAAGVRKSATALRFFSGDGEYTESLTLSQARLPDVLVADRMIGDDVTAEHGGPVRLYVAPMYGYKSIKWLDRIEVTNEIVPGYWEDGGYPVNAWIGGTQ
ncbi:MAG: molybdopterin-dependent oxidoreductase [Acidimicrobiales bacterium]|jgi:DMSO/TMAO reductase YedYZ molybdopterin-dependent catalytic subunit